MDVDVGEGPLCVDCTRRLNLQNKTRNKEFPSLCVNQNYIHSVYLIVTFTAIYL